MDRISHGMIALLGVGWLIAVGCGEKVAEEPAPTTGQARPKAATAEGVRALEEAAAAHRTNQGPRAGFKVTPMEGWADLTSFTFDAALSTDDWNTTGQLLKRWDYEGDGTWDTPKRTFSRVPYVFADTGWVRPRLWVQDAGGLIDSVVGEAIHIHPAYPPPGFALDDENPNSPTVKQTLAVEHERGHPILAWFAYPSK